MGREKTNLLITFLSSVFSCIVLSVALPFDEGGSDIHLLAYKSVIFVTTIRCDRWLWSYWIPSTSIKTCAV